MSTQQREGWKVSQIILSIFLCGFFLFLTPVLSSAQQYPTKPVNILVNKAPGGTMDICARALSSKAEKILGQPIIISNNGAGGGATALSITAKEKADGYRLAAFSSTGLVRIPQFRTVTYKLEDFIPILHFCVAPTGTVVRADSPWKTMKELVEYARQNPKKVTYSTSGIGTPMHLAMEVIAKKEGIDWKHVPYPGEAPALTALLGGHVTAESDSTAWIPHIKQGVLRLLVVHGEKRMKGFPEVPTLLELGYNFFNETVFLVAAPKGTPPSVIKKLNEAFHKAAEDPEVLQILAKLEFEPSYRDSEQTTKYLQEAYITVGKMIQEFKIPKEEEEKK